MTTHNFIVAYSRNGQPGSLGFMFTESAESFADRPIRVSSGRRAEA
ncbi:MAG: hypothetical protein HY613_02440 [Candidatus Rokubacteria bacterium]|nr:hypothetical protein [Candidatus Rokubacteria bacterium]